MKLQTPVKVSSRPLLEVPKTTTNYHCDLSSLEVNRGGRFAVSLIIGATIMTLVGAVLTTFILPGIIKPELLVKVMSSPTTPQEEVTLPPETTPFRITPLPKPPALSQAIPQSTMPMAPLITTLPTVDTDFLVDEAENTLEFIAQFEKEEEQRLQELRAEEERQRKAAEQAALLAQQKAAEEEAQRKREAEARALAARQAEARRAQERAVVARETEARRAVAATEADARRKAAATAAQAKRVASGPVITKRTSPNYPTSARSKGLQGTARISATVTASGKVSSPRIIASSGHRTLDSSALSAVKKWRFSPAKNGLGQAISHPITIPVTFRLN